MHICTVILISLENGQSPTVILYTGPQNQVVIETRSVPGIFLSTDQMAEPHARTPGLPATCSHLGGQGYGKHSVDLFLLAILFYLRPWPPWPHCGTMGT